MKNTYEIKTARTGEMIPVINDVFLHSIHNPAKEAEIFVQKYTDKIRENNQFLILGLGFGYHVQEFLKFVRLCQTQYTVYIIEPNEKLVHDVNIHLPINDSNVKIMKGRDIEKIFTNERFISFLMNKPVLIKHDPSFQLERVFYTNFLTYKASHLIKDYWENLNDDLKNSLAADDSRTLEEIALEEGRNTSLAADFRNFLLIANAVSLDSKEAL